MTAQLLLLLFGLGLTGGFLSGLLGLGGGIIMVPLLLTIPSLLGLEPISMRASVGITMVQSFAGSLAGLLVHRERQSIHRGLVLYLGASTAVGSLAGSVLSKDFSEVMLTGIFAALALVSTLLMLLPGPVK